MQRSGWKLIAVLLMLCTVRTVHGQQPNTLRELSARDLDLISRFGAAQDADDADVLTALNKSGRIRRLIDPAQIQRVPQAVDSPISLSDAYQMIRRSNDELYQSALRIPSAFTVRPEMFELIAETDDSFVIASGIELMVRDPDSLAAVSPEFRATLEENQKQMESLESLPAEERRQIEKYLTEEGSKLPLDHPLAESARKGNAALFTAIQKGLGEYQVTETITVAKRPLPMLQGRVQHPSFDQGIMDLTRLRDGSARIIDFEPQPEGGPGAFQWQVPEGRQIPGGPAERVAPESRRGSVPESRDAKSSGPARNEARPAREETIAEGETVMRDAFFTGFSTGDGWQWEKRWGFWVGHFKIKLGAGYEFGMRVPLKFEGTANPTSIRHYGRQDNPHRIGMTLKMTPFNASAANFQIAGIPESQIFEGKEFVLGASAYYHIQLRAFRRNWIDKTKNFGFDFGRDLRPPGAGETVDFRMEIPPELTRTRFDFEFLSGAAQFGLLAELQGEASIDASLMKDGEVQDDSPMSLRYNLGDTIRLSETLQPQTLPDGEQSTSVRYGLRLSNPTYRLSATLTPSVRGQVRSHVPGFRKRFNTAWIDLHRFKVELDDMKFTAHRGTQRYRDFRIGVKEYYRTYDRPSLPDSPAPGLGRSEKGTSRTLPGKLPFALDKIKPSKDPDSSDKTDATSSTKLIAPQARETLKVVEPSQPKKPKTR
jgi:hypothetical protein